MTQLIRRYRLPHLVAAFVALATCATTVFAQTPSLAELAKKEQERRKATASATKVITNKDLPKPTAPPPGTPAPAAAAPAEAGTPEATAAGDKKAEEDTDKNAKDEAYWRTRIASAREELRRAEMFQEALQSRINALSTDFVNRDDPYQRAKVAEDRQKALGELERVKADIEKTTKAVADIEEEGRVAGVPPGWLR